MNLPDLLFSESMEGDFLISAFFDMLRMTETLVHDRHELMYGLEGYTRQLLSDFVRIVFLANKAVFGNGQLGEVQIK